MASRTSTIRRERTSAATPFAEPRGVSPWIFGAPGVAVIAGVAAEWLDVRALRYPLLLVVGLGVLATAWALIGRRRDARTFALAVGIGFATWAAAETLYVIIHTVRGTPFEAERFGPQWAQALGLIAVHGAFLGAPTGLVAAVMLHAAPLWRRLRAPRRTP